MSDKSDTFEPKLDANGLLTGVVQDRRTKAVLMVAFMNREAIDKTLETGFAHFYSRSRQTLWKKGETSGNVLAVDQVLVDCDQDCLVLMVTPNGPACHTGEVGCFYRVLHDDTKNGQAKLTFT